MSTAIVSTALDKVPVKMKRPSTVRGRAMGAKSCKYYTTSLAVRAVYGGATSDAATRRLLCYSNTTPYVAVPGGCVSVCLCAV